MASGGEDNPFRRFWDNRSPDFAAVLKSNDINSRVQKHLQRVYAALAGGTVVSAGGAALSVYTGGGETVGTIGSFVFLLWLILSGGAGGASPNTIKRALIFAGYCLSQGLGLGGFIRSLLELDPSILVSAFVASAIAFTTFSLFSLVSKRRSLLYLGGSLSSLLMILVIGGLANIFLGSSFLLDVQLYLGLLVFIGYIVFDTQLIVERADQGDRDVFRHAVELFIDLVGLFVRIASILARKEKKERSRK